MNFQSGEVWRRAPETLSPLLFWYFLSIFWPSSYIFLSVINLFHIRLKAKFSRLWTVESGGTVNILTFPSSIILSIVKLPWYCTSQQPLGVWTTLTLNCETKVHSFEQACSINKIKYCLLKGLCHNISDFFSSEDLTWSPDSCPKAVLNMAPHWPGYSNLKLIT